MISFVEEFINRNFGDTKQSIKLKIPKAYQQLELYKLFFPIKMAPPIYTDLGKLARDLFRIGYHPGVWQLDCKTMTSSGIELFTHGFSNQDATKVLGSLQSKYKVEDYGLTLTERWNTDNLLFGQIAMKDKLTEGLITAIEGSFHPSTGDKTGKFWFDYVKDAFNLFGQLGVNSGNTFAGCSLVLAHNELVGGVALNYDINAEYLDWRVALGYATESIVLHTELINAQNWLVSLFNRANEQLDVGLEVYGSTNNDSSINAGLGAVYRVNEDVLVRAKVNLKPEVGLGFQQKLAEGIIASASTVIDCGHISDGNHRFGVGLSLAC